MAKKNTEEAHFSFLKHNDKTWVPRVKHGWMDGWRRRRWGLGWVGVERGRSNPFMVNFKMSDRLFFFLLYIRQKKKIDK